MWHQLNDSIQGYVEEWRLLSWNAHQVSVNDSQDTLMTHDQNLCVDWIAVLVRNVDDKILDACVL